MCVYILHGKSFTLILFGWVTLAFLWYHAPWIHKWFQNFFHTMIMSPTIQWLCLKWQRFLLCYICTIEGSLQHAINLWHDGDYSKVIHTSSVAETFKIFHHQTWLICVFWTTVISLCVITNSARLLTSRQRAWIIKGTMIHQINFMSCYVSDSTIKV